jgi:hypothetical protein
MRRFVSLATLLVASAMLAGCPIYPVDSCYSSYDCPNGYTCDSYLGQCVAQSGDDDDDVTKPPPPPPPPDRNDECSSPADCDVGETCGEKGFCLPGDCTFWGCVTGYSCTETPEGKAYACVQDGTGSGGSGGSGGEASCSSSLQAPPASGELTLIDANSGEKLSFCLASLTSDPSLTSLQTGGELGVGDKGNAEPRQKATLVIEGQIASSDTIVCNADPATDAISAKCSLTASDSAIRQVEYQTIENRPFTIRVDVWTDEAFSASAEIPLGRVTTFSGRPDTVVDEVTVQALIDVKSRVLEGDSDEGGGRPPSP